jgi:hypothetical protein
MLAIISSKKESTSAIGTELTFEAWILCSSPDQRHRTRFHERQEQILLGFREAMYLIYRKKFRTIQLNVTTSTPQAVSKQCAKSKTECLPMNKTVRLPSNFNWFLACSKTFLTSAEPELVAESSRKSASALFAISLAIVVFPQPTEQRVNVRHRTFCDNDKVLKTTYLEVPRG